MLEAVLAGSRSATPVPAKASGRVTSPAKSLYPWLVATDLLLAEQAMVSAIFARQKTSLMRNHHCQALRQRTQAAAGQRRSQP